MRPCVENLFTSTILGDLAMEIERPFSEEEIHNTVFGMDDSKAPAPNGFSMLFFQECWDMIKEDLIKVFEDFFERGVLTNL